MPELFHVSPAIGGVTYRCRVWVRLRNAANGGLLLTVEDEIDTFAQDALTRIAKGPDARLARNAKATLERLADGAYETRGRRKTLWDTANRGAIEFQQSLRTASMEVFRGEQEPIQLVVIANGRPLKNVRIAVGRNASLGAASVRVVVTSGIRSPS